MKYISYTTSLSICLCLAAAPAWAQKGKIVTQILKKPSSLQSVKPAEKALTSLSRAELYRRAVSIPDPQKLQNALQHKYISAREREKWRELRESFIKLAYLRPTPQDKLSAYFKKTEEAANFQHSWLFFNGIQSIGRRPQSARADSNARELQKVQQEYADVIKEIARTQKMVNHRIVYSSLAGEGVRPVPQQIQVINEALFNLIGKIHNLQAKLPDEPYLAAQLEIWKQTFAAFNPHFGGLPAFHSGKGSPRTDNRILEKNEFYLFNPDGTDYLLPLSKSEKDASMNFWMLQMSQFSIDIEDDAPEITLQFAQEEREKLLNQLPSGLRIAFLNDDWTPRANFQSWAAKGYLGKGAELDVFYDGDDLLDKLYNGKKYDLIITDLMVPNGGSEMMPQLRKLDKKVTVIACSKSRRGEESEEDLFKYGFDGYLWYSPRLNDKQYGYLEYLRGMANYYYYKNLHGWNR